MTLKENISLELQLITPSRFNSFIKNMFSFSAELINALESLLKWTEYFSFFLIKYEISIKVNYRTLFTMFSSSSRVTLMIFIITNSFDDDSK